MVEEDTGLYERLHRELPGILLWAIAGWTRLHERGRFIQPRSGRELLATMEDLASPISSFLRDRCVVDPDEIIPVSVLYDAWRSWCHEQGRDAVGDEPSFGRDLHAAIPGLSKSRFRQEGLRVPHYRGVRLATEFDARQPLANKPRLADPVWGRLSDRSTLPAGHDRPPIASGRRMCWRTSVSLPTVLSRVPGCLDFVMVAAMDREATLQDREPRAVNSGAPPAHALPIEAVGVDLERGLTQAQAGQRRAADGPNELEVAAPEPQWRRFLAQFQDLVILLLLAAAIVSAMLGEAADALAIIAIVVLNGVLGFLQEARAERALRALQEMSAPTARVIRGGRPMIVAASELVRGDLIELEAGDRVPADVRLVQGFGLRVQEAALTGESQPVEKDHRVLLAPSTALADRLNMAYMGTVVAAGKATGVVVATGMKTELGQIAGLLHRQVPEPTPLQRRLAELGKVLVAACLSAVALIFVLQMHAWRQAARVIHGLGQPGGGGGPRGPARGRDPGAGPGREPDGSP